MGLIGLGLSDLILTDASCGLSPYGFHRGGRAPFWLRLERSGWHRLATRQRRILLLGKQELHEV